MITRQAYNPAGNIQRKEPGVSVIAGHPQPQPQPQSQASHTDPLVLLLLALVFLVILAGTGYLCLVHPLLIAPVGAVGAVAAVLVAVVTLVHSGRRC
ncbi:hypothetical protein [Streptomyces subrutilus]|uniref:hypothetical protein n=1 Tax=Streptomyces subrutilus TaxID=36818 RepID=UPI0033F66ACA